LTRINITTNMNTNPEDMYKLKWDMSSRCLINHTTLGSTPPSQRLVPACQGIVSREVQASCHVELEIQKGILSKMVKGKDLLFLWCFPFVYLWKKRPLHVPCQLGVGQESGGCLLLEGEWTHKYISPHVKLWLRGFLVEVWAFI